MTRAPHPILPPGQQLVAPDRWPMVGERGPRASNAPWEVAIGGEVRRPGSFSLEALAKLEQVDRLVDIHCVTRWSKLQVPFRGVPLAALVARAEPGERARYVSFVARSQRDHSTSLPLAEALERDTLIALGAAGRPLPTEHGGPVRVVVPGRYFYKSLKWLARIELLADDRLGFWESAAGYHNTADPWRQQRYLAPGLTKAQARQILESRDISGRDLRSLRAAGRQLADLAARGALLRDADFRDCQLRRAVFDGANLSNAHFEGADLGQASFVGADLEGADFSGADLRGARLHGASLVAASFAVIEHGDLRHGAWIDRTTQIDADTLVQLTPDQQAYVQAALAESKDHDP